MQNQAHKLALVKKKILNFRLMTLSEYQNIKKIFQKVTLQIGQEKFLWLKILQILCRGHILLMILTEKKLL